jgi:hypothetical protein
MQPGGESVDGTVMQDSNVHGCLGHHCRHLVDAELANDPQ